jgi:hypothetical protein
VPVDGKARWSGNCTIRLIVFRDGALGGDLQAALDRFAPLGVTGEGIAQYGMVALTVPPDAELGAVKQLLRQGGSEGWWDHEEGCIGDAWDQAG